MKSISREEAIAILSDMKIDIPIPRAAVTQIKRNVALDMAIHALRCSEILNSSDTIGRQAAINALKEHRALFCDNIPDTFSKLSYAEKSRVDELDMAIATLINMPSAQSILTCDGCRHIGAYDTDFPCNRCVRREKDYYDPE